MQTEIEAKFLDIDPEALRVKLKAAGATLVHPERLMSRNVFDLPDQTFQQSGAWVRLRDEGDKITLGFKKLNDRTLHGTQEITVGVDNFEKTADILAAMGLVNKSFQETKRERWQFGNTEITIDTWPWIPTFVELEAPDEEKLKEAADKLKLSWTDAMHGSVETAYQKYYDITEEEIDSWKSVTFISVPDWLEAKRRKT